MGLLGKFGMKVPLLSKGAEAGYLKTLVQKDFFTADVSVSADKWELIGEYVVPAQQQINVGYGNPGEQLNQGTVFIDMEAAAAAGDLDGFVRIQIADANDVVKPNGVVLEERTELLSENPTDRTKQVPLPEYPVAALQDDKIQIWFKSDAAGTVGYDATTPETKIRLPTTVRRL